MNESVGSAIEEIKRQEQNKEAKLKAKRDFEAKKAALERRIRELVSQARNFQQERVELEMRTDELHSQLTIQKIRRDALAAQLQASGTKLKELKTRVEQEIAEVQKIRSSFCKAVRTVSDECDVWPLLMKPACAESLPRTIKKASDNNELVLKNEGRLKSARERREKAIAERTRLMLEPDAGEDFVRIKNALRYSMEMMANVRK